MKLEKSIIISLIVHLLLIALLAFNFHFSKVEIKQSGASRQIHATSINAKNVERLIKKIKQKDLNRKNKEIERLRKLQKATEKARKKRIEEENKAKQAKKRRVDAERNRKTEEKKAAEAKKKRIADDKVRKKKIAADKKRAIKKKADAEKKRKAEALRKKKQKAAADKKRKEDARRKKLAEEKAAQEALEADMALEMAAESEALAQAKQQQVLSEVDKYNLLISNKIKRNWIAPEQKGSCVFRINLAPGGLIIGITVLSGDTSHCDSGRRAINKSEPLPVSSDPDVFNVLRTRTFELENNSEKE